MTTCVAILGVTGGSGKWTAFHLLSAPDLPGGIPRCKTLTRRRRWKLHNARVLLAVPCCVKTFSSRYRVRALVRSPSKVQAWTDPEWTTVVGQSGSDLKSRLELVQGNARDPKAVEECLQGASTLISTVGVF